MDAHALHQSRYALPADWLAFPFEQPAQHARSGIRHFKMQFVDPAHQRQFLG
jgi:hypothetical protein